ncbi:MAG: spore cortex-lytic enzyme [Bacillota bacterium]
MQNELCYEKENYNMNNVSKGKKNLKDILLTGICITLIVAIAATALLLYTDIFVDEQAEAQLIRRGSTGSTVKEIQSRLYRWGYYTGGIDGIFGPKTEQAIRYFQRVNNLAADGVVGPKTAAAIGVRLHANTASSYSSDVHLLARCIYGEARGEPYTGQVAVGAVILNRVRNPDFPNTISGVIYQPYAFTVVSDGQINLQPDDSAYRAARDALNGWDPTNGCIYYYNPVTATNQWIRSRPVHLTIGKHVFCT